MAIAESVAVGIRHRVAGAMPRFLVLFGQAVPICVLQPIIDDEHRHDSDVVIPVAVAHPDLDLIGGHAVAKENRQKKPHKL
ncbi:MAG: hypothetical protein K9N23_20755 [Akkermansiaceae bacterium]|nr:hypothetical protein [Akkermansiaceae bacterium]